MESVKRIELPELLPVLPVRNTVLFPNTAVPLVVGRAKSVRTVKYAQKNGDILLVVTQKEGEKENPAGDDLHEIGTVCLISKIHQTDKDGFQLIANGLFRFRIHEYVEKEGYLSAKGIQISEISSSSPRQESLAQEIKNLGKTILNLAAIPGSESLHKLLNQITDPQHIADLASTFLPLPISVKQDLLETLDLEARMEKILDLMATEKEKLIVQNEIQGKMMDRLSKDQREHILREQIKTLHDELGDDADISQDYAKKIEAAEMPPEARKVAEEELARLRAVQRASPEYHVIRTYLDALVALPWNKSSATESEKIDLKQARAILDEDHYGIEKVKARILEFVAVTKLKSDMKGPILCLAGPPGVGKTSIAESIAKTLGRKFIRTSLGGLRDEAEIRGHRRTYIGAMPGRIMQAMKRAGVKDPLILLDEVDKIGTDFRGDPASALLEVLDPERTILLRIITSIFHLISLGLCL
jgi:ATP-dependent Lon protease